MYPVHLLVLDFSMELRMKYIFNGHIIVQLLPVDYDRGDSGLEEIEKVESCEEGGTVSTFELLAAEHLSALCPDDNFDKS